MEQLKERDRVLVKVDTVAGDKPIEGLLISIKDGKAYVLPDGRKTINMYDAAFVTKASDIKSEAASIVTGMLYFLKGYFTQEGKADLFSPVRASKLECVEYLIKNQEVK